MEEELYYLTGGDVSRNEYFLKMKSSDVKIYKVIKNKHGFLNWYQEAIQTEDKNK